MRKAIFDYERAVCALDAYLQEALWLQSLIKSKTTSFRSSDIRFSGKRIPVIGYLIWVWYAYLQQTVYFFLGMLFTLFSFLVVIGQIAIFWHMNPKESIIMSFFSKTAGVVSTNFAILVPLCYISICCFYGLFKIKIWGLYSIRGNRQTDAFSLIFCSTIITRLVPPLCYNFL